MLSAIEFEVLFLQVSSINRIPKPKPKIERPMKNETESSGENVTPSNSTSEEYLNQSNQSSKDSDSSSNEQVDPEPKAHDELWFKVLLSIVCP